MSVVSVTTLLSGHFLNNGLYLRFSFYEEIKFCLMFITCHTQLYRLAL
jgi:hypothetical protein